MRNKFHCISLVILQELFLCLFVNICDHQRHKRSTTPQAAGKARVITHTKMKNRALPNEVNLQGLPLSMSN